MSVQLRTKTKSATRYAIIRAPQCDATVNRMQANDMTLKGKSQKLTPVGRQQAMNIGKTMIPFLERLNVGTFQKDLLSVDDTVRVYQINCLAIERERCIGTVNVLTEALQQKDCQVTVNTNFVDDEPFAVDQPSDFKYVQADLTVIWVVSTTMMAAAHQRLGCSSQLLLRFTPVMGALTFFEVVNPAELPPGEDNICIHQIMSPCCVGSETILWHNAR